MKLAHFSRVSLCLAGALGVFLSAFAAPLRADQVTLVAGGNGPDGGPANQARVTKPFGLIFDQAGNLYIGQFGAKTEGQLVRKVDTHGIITTIAGTGKVGSGGDGGPAINGEFNFIHDIVIGPDGNLYVADSFNRKVRKIDLKTGLLTTFAGTGEPKPASGDGGPAGQAVLDGVASLWFSKDGATLYLSGFSKFVRTIDLKTGVINTVPNCPGGRSIALDSQGNLYIASKKTLRVRTPDGNVKVLLDETHLGGSDTPLAPEPKHLGIDAQDNVLICDEQHHLLRKYLPAQDKLVTLMGNGKPGADGLDGPPANAQLRDPHGVLFHDGAIYVADSMNDRVLKITPGTP
jgi:DNA-binding beta-propeller fold protein YncE